MNACRVLELRSTKKSLVRRFFNGDPSTLKSWDLENKKREQRERSILGLERLIYSPFLSLFIREE